MGNAESNGSSGIDDSGALARGKVSGEHRQEEATMIRRAEHITTLG